MWFTTRFVPLYRYALLLLVVCARPVQSVVADRSPLLRRHFHTDPEEWLVKFDSSRVLHVHGEEQSRAYHVMQPSAGASSDNSANLHSSSQRKPAILMFHGMYSDAAQFASAGSMALEGSQQGYVMVYLDGASSQSYLDSPSKGRWWNSGACGGHAFRDDVADTDFVAAVVSDLVANLSVDPARVFVAGISNGASMALRLACERPDLFAGISAVHATLEFRDGATCATNCNTTSGYCLWDSTKKGCTKEEWVSSLPSFYECNKLQEKPLPMLMVNGYRTPWSAVSGGVYDPTLKDKESWPPLEFQQHFFAKALGCIGHRSPSFTSLSANEGEEGAVRCHSYHECHAANVTFCEVAAGDWWYGAEYDVREACLYQGWSAANCNPEDLFRWWGPTTKNIDLSKEMLQFFAAH